MRLTPVQVSAELSEGLRAKGEYFADELTAVADELLEKYAGRAQLIYLDPPFLTGNSFKLCARVGEAEWRSGQGSLVLPAYADPADPDAYRALMFRALTLAHALLNETGVVFVHVDTRALPVVRALLDEIFGADHLLNEIIWVYQTGGRARTHFSRKHDVIYFYRKGKTHYFDMDAVLTQRSGARENHMRRHVDPDGRVYRSIRSGGRVYTYYDDDPVAPSDIWDDVSHMQQKDPQRTGYDTQKPLALLERIVKCASRPGDLVCDLFSGSGTTLEAAARADRDFLGVEKCPAALAVARRRLDGFKCRYHLPPDAPGASPAVEATVTPGVGMYAVKLTRFDSPDCPAGRDPFDWLDGWAVGYLENGAFQTRAQETRTRVKPGLTFALNLPVFSGEAALRATDAAGNHFYYRLPTAE